MSLGGYDSSFLLLLHTDSGFPVKQPGGCCPTQYFGLGEKGFNPSFPWDVGRAVICQAAWTDWNPVRGDGYLAVNQTQGNSGVVLSAVGIVLQRRNRLQSHRT